MTGTFMNITAVLVGTFAGVTVGDRLSEGMQQRVLMGLGLITAALGIDLALAWGGEDAGDRTVLYVLGGVLIGGIVGEAIGIERRLEELGDRLQARFARGDGAHSHVSEGFVDASLLFCVGSLAVIGSIQDGLTGDWDTLATKSILDGFAAIALAATLGWGVGLSVFTILIYQGAITLGAGFFDDILVGEALAAMTSAGGITILGISLKLLGVLDVKVGNFLPAIVLAPALVGLVSLF
jgi:uncharacterized membrane protein YqgA involved in biofilm formation